MDVIFLTPPVMKKILIIILLANSSYLIAQQDERVTDNFISSPINVAIETDIDFASSTNDTRRNARSGIGTLGLSYEQGFTYGGVNFTVYSQNEQITTEDSTETTLFGSSLLLPKNSSDNISNFSILIGTKSIYAVFDPDWTGGNLPMASWKRFGARAYFNVNNTTWVKDSLSTPITINSFGVDLTYLILDIEMPNNDNERISLMASLGYVARRLGGDYGLDSNSDVRTDFIGTDKLGFDGMKVTFRLEVAKFYGQMDLTSFSRGLNISGFSGDQAVVSIGIKADLDLKK